VGLLAIFRLTDGTVTWCATAGDVKARRVWHVLPHAGAAGSGDALARRSYLQNRTTPTYRRYRGA